MARTLPSTKTPKATPKSGAKKGNSSVKAGTSKPSLEAPLVVSGKRSVKKPERAAEEGYEEEIDEMIDDDEEYFQDEEEDEDDDVKPKKGKSQKVAAKTEKSISFKPKAESGPTRSRASGRVRIPKKRDDNDVYYDAEGNANAEEAEPVAKKPAAPKATAKKAVPPPPPPAPAATKKGSSKAAPAPAPAPAPPAKTAAPAAKKAAPPPKATKVPVKGGVAKKTAPASALVVKGKRKSTSEFSRR